MASYAATTTVSAERSADEIKSYLRKRGAQEIATFETGDKGALMFKLDDRVFRFVVQVPMLDDFSVGPSGRRRNLEQARKAADQEWRRRWRVLALVLKGKFELVDSGVVELEEEFLSFIVAADGRTVYEHMRPALNGGQQNLIGHMPAFGELGSGS